MLHRHILSTERSHVIDGALSRDVIDGARGEVCNGLAGVAESRVVQGFVLCHSKLTEGW